jgi:hypothetical protein
MVSSTSVLPNTFEDYFRHGDSGELKELFDEGCPMDYITCWAWDALTYAVRLLQGETVL